MKHFLVKDFLNLHFVDVCCLQESKLHTISGITWREISGPRLDQFSFLPSIGMLGDIIVGWNSVLIKGSIAMRESFAYLSIFVLRRTTSHGGASQFMDRMHGIVRELFGMNLRDVVAIRGFPG